MTSNFRIYWTTALLLIGSLAAAQNDGAIVTQPDTAEQAAPAELQSDDLLDRLTPRRAARGFLLAAEDGNFERAAEYLDLRNLPRTMTPPDGPSLAEDLDVILQRNLWVDLQELSDEIDGWSGDGLPAYRDRLGMLQTREGQVTLLLQQVPREDGVLIWKVSNSTVALIPGLYSELGYPRFVENLRKQIPDMRFFGIELFKWIIALTIGLLVYLLFLIGSIVVSRFFSTPGSPRSQLVRNFIARPTAAMAAILAMNAISERLGVGVSAQRLTEIRPIFTLILLWFLVASAGLARDLYNQHLIDTGRGGKLVLLRPMTSFVQLIIAGIVLLLWLENAGFQITTLLAGLGVGGLAVALVLQRPLEDVFGAITLYSQQPVRVGDFCRVGTFVGTVEEISLRTTRIRTMQNTLVAIPNSKIATEEIDNISMRQKIWYHPTLKLRPDSTSDQIGSILDEIRTLLASHESVIEGATVRLVGIGDYTTEIGLRAYIATTDYDEFLAIGEELNLAIMNIVFSSGAEFASPFEWRQEN